MLGYNKEKKGKKLFLHPLTMGNLIDYVKGDHLWGLYISMQNYCKFSSKIVYFSQSLLDHKMDVKLIDLLSLL